MNSSFVGNASLPRRDSLYLKQQTPILQTPKSKKMQGIISSAVTPMPVSLTPASQNRRLSVIRKPSSVPIVNTPLHSLLPAAPLSSAVGTPRVSVAPSNPHFQILDEFKKREDRLIQEACKLRDENTRLKLELQDVQKAKVEEFTLLRKQNDDLEGKMRFQSSQFASDIGNLQNHLQSAKLEHKANEDSLKFEIQSARDLNGAMARQLEKMNIHPVTLDTLAEEDEARRKQTLEFTVCRQLSVYYFAQFH